MSKSPYSDHSDQLKSAQPSDERVEELRTALQDAFGKFSYQKATPWIDFDAVSVEALAEEFYRNPILVRSVMGMVNAASRAVKRDCGITLNTYSESISRQNAIALAEYIKPMLAGRNATFDAILNIDRYLWTDKAMRAAKGAWEKSVTEIINANSIRKFKKRKFHCQGEEFEIDAAHVDSAGLIQVAVDVKRIESPRDIHKRADEIVNKAIKYKLSYPSGRFFAFIYYPFVDEHMNLVSRLKNVGIDGVYFAGEYGDSIELAVREMLNSIGYLDVL